jgi:hypothetical protein
MRFKPLFHTVVHSLAAALCSSSKNGGDGTQEATITCGPTSSSTARRIDVIRRWGGLISTVDKAASSRPTKALKGVISTTKLGGFARARAIEKQRRCRKPEWRRLQSLFGVEAL